MTNYYLNYAKSIDQALKSLEITDRGGASIAQERAFDQLCAMSSALQQTGACQFLCGNGASAAFSNHMALDWTKNGGVPTHSFSDSALLTAIGNDLGYEEAFCAPLSWYAKSGDQLVAISSSGNSPNILKTIETARSKGMTVVTLSGLKPDNASRKLGDINFYVPAKTYGVVECAHQVLLHVWLDKFLGLEEWNRDNVQNMRKGDYVG
jgi:D-sedoheptulose 7-phosphate isomerase